MGLIIKMTVSIYVLSVLIFSSFSRAENTVSTFGQKQNAQVSFINSKGTVFEADGILYFEDLHGQISLIHSNDFDLFSNIELPVKVSLVGLNINRSSFSYQPQVVQITELTLLEEKP